ncbi:unnamed protein product [Ectocarpus sp. CCAP 1310/34]|nr:unnamed protein product [Ectocarpus sp. CCAP 1310/34]
MKAMHHTRSTGGLVCGTSPPCLATGPPRTLAADAGTTTSTTAQRLAIAPPRTMTADTGITTSTTAQSARRSATSSAAVGVTGTYSRSW